jgi:hypothetical protein
VRVVALELVGGKARLSVCPSVTVYSADRRAVKISAPFKMLSQVI